MREQLFNGPDGPIWPLARPQMTEAGLIGQRMVEDLTVAARQGKPVAFLGRAGLLDLGWSARQVLAHGEAAVRSFQASLERLAA